MKLLVIDDDTNIRNIIKEYASLENHIVYEAYNGKTTIEILNNIDPDIIILDIMLPDTTGYDLAKKILNIKDVPILMLSAKGEIEDKLEGFASGAIDYMTKPFSPKELMARLKVMQKKKSSNIVKIFGILIDNQAKKVYIDSQEISLTTKEYELLFYFVQNKNILLNRETILDNVWGQDFIGIDRTIDTHVKMIRKKIGKYGNKIITIRGEGYRFEG